MVRTVVHIDADQARPRAPALVPRGPMSLASAVGNRAFTAWVARQTGGGPIVAPKPPDRRKLDYARAKGQNERYAKPTTVAASSSLGWEDKLASGPRTAARPA